MVWTFGNPLAVRNVHTTQRPLSYIPGRKPAGTLHAWNDTRGEHLMPPYTLLPPSPAYCPLAHSVRLFIPPSS